MRWQGDSRRDGKRCHDARMTKYLVVLVLAACGGSKTPPAEPTPTPTQPDTQPPAPATMSPDECTSKGGHVKGDIGDGKVACDAGEKELGRVSQGIEGAICCIAGGDPAAPPATP